MFATMKEMGTIFHGSNVKVEKLEILVSGFYKDFVFGFYCTVLEKQAQKWALAKRGPSIVPVFRFQALDGLLVLSFPEMTDIQLIRVLSAPGKHSRLLKASFRRGTLPPSSRRNRAARHRWWAVRWRAVAAGPAGHG